MRVSIAHSIASASQCLGLVLATCAVGCGAGEGDAIQAVDAGKRDAVQPVDAGATPTPDAPASPPKGGGGVILVSSFGVVATFSPEVTAVHFDDAPGCVLHLQPIRSGMMFTPAGTLLIGGPVVGTPGAMPEPIVPVIQSAGYYVYTAGPVFGATDEFLVEVSLAGSSTLPPMGVQTVRPPAAEPVTLLQPAPGGLMTLRTAQPFELVWTAPVGQKPDHRLFVSIRGLSDVREGHPASMTADILCGFPIDAGRGTIPARVLAKLAELMGGLPLRGGHVDIGAGDWKEYTGNETSYVIEVTRAGGEMQPAWTFTTAQIVE